MFEALYHNIADAELRSVKSAGHMYFIEASVLHVIMCNVKLDPFHGLYCH